MRHQLIRYFPYVTKTKSVFFCLIIVGVVYRIVLGSFAEHRLVWDMEVYDRLGRSVADGNITADCCLHGIGYPLFLGTVYRLFGGDRLQNVRYAQAALDTSTAVIIYFAARKLLNRKSARWAFVLYLFNPITAAYTGLILTETVALWCMALIVYALVFLSSFPQMMALFGIGIGLLVITKLSFYYFSFWLIALLFYLSFRRGIMKYFFCLFLPVFLICILYPLNANYRLYHTVGIGPPYHTTYGLLYIFSGEYKGRYPELAVDFQEPVDPTFVSVMNEFYEYERNNPQAMPVYGEKYETLFWSNISSRWPFLLKNTVGNMIRIWDKRFLFLYTDPLYPRDTIILRIGTVLFLSLSFSGFLLFVRRNRSTGTLPVVLYTVSLFLYISFVFALVSNETRHALPFYPIASIWAGYGIVLIAGMRHGKKGGLSV